MKNIIIATHDKAYHADDIVGVSLLLIAMKRQGKSVEIIRTREPLDIDRADFAVDVGMVEDSTGGRFDHHQRKGTPASAGLVLNWFENAYDTFPEVIRKWVNAIDAVDVGIVEPKGESFTTSISELSQWSNALGIQDEIFTKITHYIAEKLLSDAILEKATEKDGSPSDIDWSEFPEYLMAVDWKKTQYENPNIALSNENYWTHDGACFFPKDQDAFLPYNLMEISKKYPKALLIIRGNDTQYGLQAIPKENEGRFSMRVAFEGSLAEEIKEAGASFVHQMGFFLAVKKQDGDCQIIRKIVDLIKRASEVEHD
jgi:uncharacterized UPF0160 family protein